MNDKTSRGSSSAQPYGLGNHRGKLHSKFETGLKHHAAGNLQKARQFYLKVLKSDPRHNGALHMLGLLANQTGDAAAAIKYLGRALEDNPDSPELFTNFGNALQSSGRLEEAINAFQNAIRVNRDFALAHNNLGNALQAAGNVDEAIAAYQQAIKLSPNYAQAHYNLANALLATGKQDKAIAWYRSALAIDPALTEASKNLAKVLMDRGETEEAVAFFKRVLQHNRNDSLARHLLAALQGETTSTAPRDYVIELFDSVAGSFDQRLVEELEYKGPEYLFSAVQKHLGNAHNTLEVLDLGCGTGLCGPLFRGMASTLTGIDLSPNMLAAASRRGVYDSLILGDIRSELAARERSCDVIIAADVFIYVGELKDTFSAAGKALKAGGLFAFSLEAYEEQASYVLRRSGRYAHAIGYIRELMPDAGLHELSLDQVTLRKENDAVINGYICVLQKAPKYPE
jgi:predicted TPR repeat methyltransferase